MNLISIKIWHCISRVVICHDLLHISEVEILLNNSLLLVEYVLVLWDQYLVVHFDLVVELVTRVLLGKFLEDSFLVESLAFSLPDHHKVVALVLLLVWYRQLLVVLLVINMDLSGLPGSDTLGLLGLLREVNGLHLTLVFTILLLALLVVTYLLLFQAEGVLSELLVGHWFLAFGCGFVIR